MNATACTKYMGSCLACREIRTGADCESREGNEIMFNELLNREYHPVAISYLERWYVIGNEST